jgi:class 3 adenylate cyclase
MTARPSLARWKGSMSLLSSGFGSALGSHRLGTYDSGVPELPSGTVTFVFTDIEGSTELLTKLGERYRALLAGHRRIVRTTFGTANGIEIDMQGDAFFFAFPRARDAVNAAVEVQRAHVSTEWPEGLPVRVRIGLHTGEPAVDDEGYLGLDVVRAARICTVARGGHVLLSESTRALLGSTLPDGVSVYPLGERHLKNIDEPERVYELAIEGVETDEVAEAEKTAADAPVEPALRGQPEAAQSFEELGAQYAARIQEKVLRSLLGEDKGDRRSRRSEDGESDSVPEGEDADVEDLAARASELQDRITARVEEALRARGISPDS